jgi:hypothetical protein
MAFGILGILHGYSEEDGETVLLVQCPAALKVVLAMLRWFGCPVLENEAVKDFDGEIELSCETTEEEACPRAHVQVFVRHNTCAGIIEDSDSFGYRTAIDYV